jgi:hypothetical protein
MRVECSILGCQRTTGIERWADPRDRWLLGIKLKDEDGEIVLNLCPAHAKEVFGLHERDFAELEKTERMIAETSNERPV